MAVDQNAVGVIANANTCAFWARVDPEPNRPNTYLGLQLSESSYLNAALTRGKKYGRTWFNGATFLQTRIALIAIPVHYIYENPPWFDRFSLRSSNSRTG
jgi:hypothetical protein